MSFNFAGHREIGRKKTWKLFLLWLWLWVEVTGGRTYFSTSVVYNYLSQCPKYPVLVYIFIHHIHCFMPLKTAIIIHIFGKFWTTPYSNHSLLSKEPNPNFFRMLSHQIPINKSQSILTCQHCRFQRLLISCQQCDYVIINIISLWWLMRNKHWLFQYQPLTYWHRDKMVFVHN